MSRDLKPAPKVGILVTPEEDNTMEDCCEDWEDVEVMPFWGFQAIINDSLEARQEPNFCPMCGSKLEHSEETDDYAL